MSHSDLTNFLSTTRLSHYLNLHELNVLVKHGALKKFPVGTHIINQGKFSDGIYIVLEGTATVIAKILGEGTTKLALLGHGNLIGGINLFDKNRSSSSTIARSELTCLYISNQYLSSLSVVYPHIYYQLQRTIADEICEHLKKFHQIIIQIMQQTDMVTRSLFSTFIKSLNEPTLLDMNETEFYASQLLNIDFFNHFMMDERTELFKNCDLIKAPTDCPLIQEGYVDASLYIVLYGAVQSSIIHDNKVAKLSVLGPLELFSSISIFNDTTPSIVNYTTCERSILVKITEKSLTQLQNNHLPIWCKVFDLICQSLVVLARSAEKLDIRLNSELYNR